LVAQVGEFVTVQSADVHAIEQEASAGRTVEAAQLFIIVLLPEPDAPMMATNSPGWMDSVTPRTAWTFTSPVV